MHWRTNGLITIFRVRPRCIPVACPSQCAIQWRGYSSGSSDTQDIAILGGGVSGLASAYYLTQEIPKAKITIYEASDRLGGWLSSRRVPVKDGTVLFEAGPRTLRPSSNGVLSARLVRGNIAEKDKWARLIGCSCKS